MTSLRDALCTIALFGVPGAFVADGSTEELLTHAKSVAAELGRRLTEARTRIADANTAPNPGQIREAAEQAVRATFGQGFVFLPRFVPSTSASEELNLALGAGTALLDDDEQAPRRWLQQAARVRAPLSRWRKLTLCAVALGGRTAAPDPSVAQLPFDERARWAALRFKGAPPASGRLSLAMFRAATPSAADPWVGLVLDEWSELIPHPAAQTGVVLHYDDPGAEAPQCALIAVPPTTTVGTWDAATLVDILHEALDLTRVRLVEAEMLTELGQLLPGLFVASNAAGEAIATDLARMTTGDVQVGP